jgi:hypothetical protein
MDIDGGNVGIYLNTRAVLRRAYATQLNSTAAVPLPAVQQAGRRTSAVICCACDR